MLNSNQKFSIFAGQKTGPKGFDENPTLYRDFTTVQELNTSPTPLIRVGPDIRFFRPSGATFFDSTGLIQITGTNIPRFEYNPEGNYKGLLIEEQRANLINYSSDFTQASTWFVAASTEGPGVTLTNDLGLSALDGSLSVTKMTDTSAIGFHCVSWLPGTDTDDEFYDRSIFIKRDTARYITIGCAGTPFANNVFTTYDFELSSFPENTPFDNVYAEPIRDGWIKIGFLRDSTFENTNTNRLLIGIGFGVDGSSVFHTEPVSELKSVYIWGAQVEKGTHPTSYIPTNGQSTIRAADLASVGDVRFVYMYNRNGGSFFIRGSRNYVTAPNSFASFTNLNASNYWTLQSNTNETNKHEISINDGGDITTITSNDTVTSNTNYTLTVGITGNNVIFYQNQQLVSEINNSILLPTTPSEFRLGRLGEQFLNGHVLKFGYWPRRLPNNELQAL